MSLTSFVPIAFAFRMLWICELFLVRIVSVFGNVTAYMIAALSPMRGKDGNTNAVNADIATKTRININNPRMTSFFFRFETFSWLNQVNFLDR